MGLMKTAHGRRPNMGERAPDNAAPVATPATVQRLQIAASSAFAMLAGMQLQLFTSLSAGPRYAEALAAERGVSAERLSRLLYALSACGLLERRQNGFANTPEAAKFLVKGLPDYIGGVHELLDQLWHADLMTALSIRSGRPAAVHDYTAMTDDELAAMLRGMHGSAVSAARDLLTQFDFSQCRSLMDVGGGSGGLVAAFCAARPDVVGVLFELSRTAALAAGILKDVPGGNRVTIETGDILLAPPRERHDAVVMRALVQVLSPSDAAQAIRNASAALRPGGAIYITGGGILDNDRLAPIGAVFLNVTFMNLYRAGASYTEAEYADWLAAAGCEDVRRAILPTGASVIHARKHR
jgi:SAM-dependent methyltransferase